MKKLIFMFFTLFFIKFSHATTNPNLHTTIIILFEQENLQYADTLVLELKKSQAVNNNNIVLHINQININNYNNSYITKNNNIIVTIGDSCFETALSHTNKIPIIATMIHKTIYINLLNKYHNSTLIKPPMTTAFYREQPIDRQLDLVQAIKTLTKENLVLGILCEPNANELIQKITDLAQKRNILINIKIVEKKDDYMKNLQDIFKKIDLFLILDEPYAAIFNAKNAAGMLITASHYKTPVIGYSKAYVNGGACIAIYTNEASYINENINFFYKTLKSLTTKKLPKPQYPQNYSIAINKNISYPLMKRLPNKNGIKNLMETLTKNNFTGSS